MDKSIAWADADSDLSILRAKPKRAHILHHRRRLAYHSLRSLCHLCIEAMMIVAGGSCVMLSSLMACSDDR